MQAFYDAKSMRATYAPSQRQRQRLGWDIVLHRGLPQIVKYFPSIDDQISMAFHQSGATLVEYAILVALIGVISIAALSDTGERAADSLCTGAGYVRRDPVELTYSAGSRCCGYVQPGVGGGFVCVN